MIIPDLLKIFQTQRASFPDRVAVSDGSGFGLTYLELDERSGRLASFLRHKGVGACTLVGICMERGVGLVVAILGVWKAGGAYVPIDPTYPQQRIDHIVGDSGVGTMVAQQSVIEKCKTEHVVSLDGQWTEIEKWPMLAGTGYPPDGPAYVIYTSGTTGQPKGVVVGHRSVVNMILDSLDRFAVTQSDVCLQFTSIGFDVSVNEILLGILSGARLAIIPEAGRQDRALFLSFVKEQKVSVALLPYSFLRSLDCAHELGLRVLVTGGEAPSHRDAVFYSGRMSYFNAYGPTEATVCATYFKIDPSRVPDPVPIGKPIANVAVYILDESQRPQPVGLPGEIFIAGVGLAKGYHNQAGLTAEKFVVHPFEEGGRIYRTGDMGRWLPDGNIEFLGRKDDQVKVRGHRVELGEIEGALQSHRLIKQAAVVSREINSQRQLVCYFVPTDREDRAPAGMEIKGYLSERLPVYMVPLFYVPLEEMPLTPNGKVDRRLLAGRELSLAAGDTYRAPTNAIEHKLCGIWEEILGVSRVGIDDNFFDLGGDSIKSIQVTSRSLDSKIKIRTKDIFNHQTVRELALNCREEDIVAEQNFLTGPVPLAPIQKWFFKLMHTNINHWNQSFILPIPPNLSKADVEELLNKLIHHHDSLRLRFSKENDQWVQYYSNGQGQLIIESHDVTSLSKDTEKVITYFSNKLHTKLDIQKGPLIAAGYFKVEQGNNQLLIIIHHLLVDGVSWRIIFEDIASLLKEKNNFSFSAKTSSYRSWVERVNGFINDKRFTSDVIYWEKKQKLFEKIPTILQAEEQHELAENFTFSLSRSQTESLAKKVHQVYNTQINDILMAALLQAWRDYFDGNLAISLESHGREELFDDINLSKTVGWFTNEYPVIFESRDFQDNGQIIKYVKEILRTIPNSGISYGLLKHSMNDQRFKEVEPEIIFNYFGSFETPNSSKEDFPDSYAGNPIDKDFRLKVITINGTTRNGITSFYLSSSYKLKDGKDLHQFGKHFERNLVSLITYCIENKSIQFTPSDFPLLGWGQTDLDELIQITGFKPEDIETINPLTPLQSGILFESLKTHEKGLYFLQNLFELQGHFDSNKFELTFRWLLKKYDVLRTSFYHTGLPGPVQVTYKKVQLAIEYHNWSSLPEMQKGEKESGFIQRRREQAFDLSKAPLVRVFVLQLAERKTKLLIESHHILLDGWSNAILLSDLFSGYNEVMRGSILPDTISTPFALYIKHATSKKDEGMFFWKNYLNGFDSPTPLPLLGLSRVTEKEPFQSHGSFKIEFNQIGSSLTAYSKENRVTTNTIIQTALAITLGLIIQSEEIVIGSVSSGRSQMKIDSQSMVGLLINTTPLRIRVQSEQKVVDLLKIVQEEGLQRMEYEFASLTDIRQFTKIPNKDSLFQILYIFENYPVDTSKFELDTLKIVGVQNAEQDHYPLSFAFGFGDHLSLHIKFDNFYYDQSTVQKIAAYFQVVVNSLLERREICINEISLLTPTEEQTIAQWNSTEFPYPDEKCIHDFLEEQAIINPLSIALRSKKNQITFGELHDITTRIATHLQSMGTGPETRVGVCMERSFEMVYAIFGILKAGGAYVPIAPTFPNDRIQYAIEDSKIEILLTQSILKDRLKEITNDLKVELLTNEEIPLHKAVLAKSVKPHNAAYVIYTSGTTGRPKGVIIEHSSLVNRICWMQNEYPLIPIDVILQKTPYTFDVSVWELVWWCVTGSSLLLLDPEEEKFPDRIIEAIKDSNVSVMHFVPSMLMAFNDYVKNSSSPVYLPSLRHVFCSGEALSRQSAEDFLQLFPAARLSNLYGPTEATIDVTYFDCEKPLPQSIPIGKPIWNTEIQVLDTNRRQQPIGIFGELFIGGIGLAREYQNKAELTLEKFVPHPTMPRKKLYRSGDLARWMPDGNIEYAGRLDHQVKIRGNRIELMEVENVLCEHPSIRQAVVIAKKIKGDFLELIGYYVSSLKDKSLLLESELKSFISKKLPDYMVPTRIIGIEEIPFTNNGKLDRKFVESLEISHSNKEEYLMPTNPIEQTLCKIWKEILEIDKVGTTNNFFDLGGHSLLAIKIISRINKELLVGISIQELFAHPTIQELSHLIIISNSVSSELLTEVLVNNRNEFEF